MELSCPFGIRALSRKEKLSCFGVFIPYNKSFIDQACSVKMDGYWLRSFSACLWTSTSSRSISTQKKNLANIQPSWPHACSIIHIYLLLTRLFSMKCILSAGSLQWKSFSLDSRSQSFLYPDILVPRSRDPFCRHQENRRFASSEYPAVILGDQSS